ncbi:MAG: hypothetical protein BWX71_02748 [Deltaproteobacteria bacterium ADurb.Bin072]|nr:MAG: hypothetical protein BWX71_02748 [Deltaproteobacteria bacterium ADurb.Bin072]
MVGALARRRMQVSVTSLRSVDTGLGSHLLRWDMTECRANIWFSF